MTTEQKKTNLIQGQDNPAHHSHLADPEFPIRLPTAGVKALTKIRELPPRLACPVEPCVYWRTLCRRHYQMWFKLFKSQYELRGSGSDTKRKTYLVGPLFRQPKLIIQQQVREGLTPNTVAALSRVSPLPNTVNCLLTQVATDFFHGSADISDGRANLQI